MLSTFKKHYKNSNYYYYLSRDEHHSRYRGGPYPLIPYHWFHLTRLDQCPPKARELGSPCLWRLFWDPQRTCLTAAAGLRMAKKAKKSPYNKTGSDVFNALQGIRRPGEAQRPWEVQPPLPLEGGGCLLISRDLGSRMESLWIWGQVCSYTFRSIQVLRAWRNKKDFVVLKIHQSLDVDMNLPGQNITQARHHN